MTDLLVRDAVAVAVVLLLPFAMPLARPWRALGCAALVGLALAPHLDELRAWAAVALVAAAASIAGYDQDKPAPTLAIGVAAWLATLAICGFEASTGALGDVLESRAVTLVVFGGLATVFAGGVLVGRLLGPLLDKLDEPPPGLRNAGRLIGWLERALIYALIVAGAPGGVALVVGLKTAARFPTFRDESFAEYSLIGTLVSVALAGGMAVGVRAAIGVDAIP